MGIHATIEGENYSEVGIAMGVRKTNPNSEDSQPYECLQYTFNDDVTAEDIQEMSESADELPNTWVDAEPGLQITVGMPYQDLDYGNLSESEKQEVAKTAVYFADEFDRALSRGIEELDSKDASEIVKMLNNPE